MKLTSNFAVKIMVSGIAMFAAGCQPPPAPDTSSSSDTKAVSSNGEAAPQGPQAPGGASFIAGGANIGTEEMKSAVKKCLDAKKFYDRQTSTCTDLSLADVNCSLEEIKTAMSEDQYKTFNGYLADAARLKDFLIDQCLACPDPSANTFCKGSTSPAEKGFRIFLVKQVDQSINIHTVYINAE